MTIPDSARAVLEGSALAHLVTLEPDGRPQVSRVWVGIDGEEIVAGHLPEHRKVRNIRRDPRVALSVEAGTRNEWGSKSTSSTAALASPRAPPPSHFSAWHTSIWARTSSFRRWMTRRNARRRRADRRGGAMGAVMRGQ